MGSGAVAKEPRPAMLVLSQDTGCHHQSTQTETMEPQPTMTTPPTVAGSCHQSSQNGDTREEFAFTSEKLYELLLTYETLLNQESVAHDECIPHESAINCVMRYAKKGRMPPVTLRTERPPVTPVRRSNHQGGKGWVTY